MRLFGHSYRYLFILLLGTYSYANIAYLETFHYYGINEQPFYEWLTILLVVALVWEGNRMLERILHSRWVKSPLKVDPLLLFFLLSLPLAWLSGMIPFQAIAGWYFRKSPEEMRIASKLITIFAFRINLFLHCINALLFFLNRSRQQELEAEFLKRSHAQASLQAIRNQINPHFLFNNLNVLSALIIRKSEDANDFVEAFSTVYRYILNSRDKELVPLSEELEFIQPYLFLLGKRFEAGLTVNIHVPEEAKSLLIVPAALQLLVENAIKHNIVSGKQPLHIDIRTGVSQDLLVENTLQRKTDAGESTQIGLNNISQRYRLISGRDIGVTETPLLFTVTLPLLNVERA
jgi:two-component system, LytTR family, sensor kinase